jgi:hypothetical protein
MFCFVKLKFKLMADAKSAACVKVKSVICKPPCGAI